jgi:hypothetical protein
MRARMNNNSFNSRSLGCGASSQQCLCLCFWSIRFVVINPFFRDVEGVSFGFYSAAEFLCEVKDFHSTYTVIGNTKLRRETRRLDCRPAGDENSVQFVFVLHSSFDQPPRHQLHGRLNGCEMLGELRNCRAQHFLDLLRKDELHFFADGIRQLG